MKKLVLPVLSVVLLSGLAVAAVKSDRANWDNLKQLAPGQEVKIVLNDAKAYRGQVQTATDEAIVVRLATGEQCFQRQSVLRVSTQSKGHRGRNALIGLAVGLGTGVIVGVASPELGQGKCAQGSCVGAESISLAGFVGAAVGAGIGAGMPTGGWHDVYRAR